MLDYKSFSQSFNGDLALPGDLGYDEGIKRWAVNGQRNAKVVAFPKNAEGVSQAILHARHHGLPLAVCGGGHSAFGASSSEGLVINLSRHLSSVVIDENSQIAYVGGGATWEQVDKAAIQHGLAAAGGVVNHTGVGGLTLGGGYGWLTGAHGLACDNLVEATIATADGSILTVNDSENSDLFWAIRGGGSNFGVVIEFIFKLHSQRRTVFCGMLTFAAEVFEPLMYLTNKFWSNIKENEGMLQVFSKPPKGSPVPIIALYLFFNGSEEEARENFREFYALGPIQDTTAEVPYEVLNTTHASHISISVIACTDFRPDFQNHMVEPGIRRTMKGTFQFKQDLPSLKLAFDRIMELSSDTHIPTIMFEYYSLKKVKSIPNDATAFNRSHLGSNVCSLISWTGESPEALTDARRMAIELIGIISDGQKRHSGEAKSMGGYGNYDQLNPGRRRGAEELFGENYPRLQQIKNKYDPECIFSKWFPITPA